MLEKKVWLSSPTMHGEELEYIKEAYDTNWVSTVGKNIDELEKGVEARLGIQNAVALASGTSALHLALRVAGTKIYGYSKVSGSLLGKKVFCSDMTFAATVNPIVYEGGEPIFIDSEYETWNMDPLALEKAFKSYPEVKIVVLAHLYGVPAKIDEIQEICKKNNAVLIEDAAESLGATYKGKETGTFGAYNIISFNGNKIITGSSGGMLLTDDEDVAKLVRKWSTQSRENASWYQHEEIGYNYRMSNIIAGIVRGQMHHLDEHILQKKKIYNRYKEGLKDIPIKMNPFEECSDPNYWLSCITIDKEFMAAQFRDDRAAKYEKIDGKSTPTEILEILSQNNAEGRPIWKPMHMQPIYKNHIYIKLDDKISVDEDIFERGLCLPSDNKMTEKEQGEIIRIIKGCFNN